MRVAFTGSSSTGKSTLAVALMSVEWFSQRVETYLPSEGKEVLAGLGFVGLDSMTQEQTAFYELAYFARKVGREAGVKALLTDRSFVDVAAYWAERDAVGRGAYFEALLVDPCRRLAHTYDYHFLLPTGAIPFEHDGRRSVSKEFHDRIDRRIRCLLNDWEIEYVEIADVDVQARVNTVLEVVRQLQSQGIQ